MNNRMLESVKKAGFYVDDEGKIWAPHRHGILTNEITALIKILDQELKLSRWEEYVDCQSNKVYNS